MSLVEQLLAAGERCYQGEDATLDLKDVLESGSAAASPEQCEQLLMALKTLLNPKTSKGEALLDVVGWDLPSAIVSYVKVSRACEELAMDIIRCLATACSPREIITTLLEALHIQDSNSLDLEACVVLLEGISTVLPRLERRRASFARQIVVGLLSLALVAEKQQNCQLEMLDMLVEKLVLLCKSLQSMYDAEKAQDQKEILRKILVSYVLIVLVLAANASEPSKLFSELLRTLEYCGLTGTTLMKESIAPYTDVLSVEEYDRSFHLEAECGASLAILLYYSVEGKWPCGNILPLLNKSECLFTFMLSHNGSWKLALQGTQLVQTVLSAHKTASIVEEDGASTSATVSSFLEMLEEVVVRSRCPKLSKSAYDAILNILRRVPADVRYACLVHLISNACHPSMVPLLLTFAKDQLRNSWPPEGGERDPFTSKDVLELMEIVLRPRHGGPPELPTDLDAVVGALNLYRFILIREISGGTNYTGIRSKPELTKVKKEWLLPLGAVVASLPPPEPDNMQFCFLLDSLQMIRCRCLELVESELDAQAAQ